ncbi:MAG: exo-beta-N-acetylmuramidase NamZ domain-containing protein [Gemmatimonadales bacterium]
MLGTSALEHAGSRVRPGIDVLLSDSSALIDGKRVGLITNASGVDASGTSTIDRLAHHAGTSLAALFAPEHGIRGQARPGEAVSDTTDAATGLPIYSLYGASRAPSAAQLAAIDVLVVDLQDAGTRTWTYVSTMVYAMRAARAALRRIVVLDRPNPIGCTMDGPVLDTAYASFIAMLPVPLRHGMTMGELARFANAELHIGADLVVVPMKGYRRCMWFDETGLPWVRPSPNLADLEAVAWYPGTVLFEATNLSTVRGTYDAFKQIGAPWLDFARLLTVDPRLREIARAVEFTPHAPGDGKYDGVALRGLRLRREHLKDAGTVETLMRVMSDIATAYPDSFTVDPVGLARRLGVGFDPRHPPDCGSDFGDCRSLWPREIAAFRAQAMPYFLYR